MHLRLNAIREFKRVICFFSSPGFVGGFISILSLFLHSCKMCGILIECLHFIKLTMATINTIPIAVVSTLIQLGHVNCNRIFLRLKRSKAMRKYLAQRLD